MIGLIFKYRKYIGILLAAIGLYTVGYIKGDASQAIKCAQAKEREVTNAVIKHEENKREVMSLDDTALRAAYCEWVRDDKQKCLSANIPISE